MEELVGALNRIAGTLGLEAAGAANAIASRFTGYATNVQQSVYGAVGDGTTNDRAAIQSAIDAVEAAGGGTVFFPKGTYLVSTSLRIDASNVRLLGAPGAVIKLAAAANCCVIIVGKNAAPAGADVITDIVIEALEIDGSISTQTARGAGAFETAWDNCGVLVVGTDRFTMRDCTIRDCWATGLSIQRSRASRTVDNSFRNVGMDLTQAVGGRNGISVYGIYPGTVEADKAGRRHIIAGNHIATVRDNYISVNSNGTADCSIVNNVIEGRAQSAKPQWGIAVETESGSTVGGGLCAIAGNVISRMDRGIQVNAYAQQGEGVSVTGNHLNNIYGTAIYLQGSRISCVGNTVHLWAKGIEYDGSGNPNEFEAADAPGIQVAPASPAGSSEIVVADNVLYTTGVSSLGGVVDQPGIQAGTSDPATAALDSVVISGNSVRGAGPSTLSSQTAGIRVFGATRVTVVGNSVRRFAYGISVNSTKGSVVSGNACSFNNWSGILIETQPEAILVIGNICTNNGQVATNNQAGIRLAGATTGTVVPVVLSNNICTDDQATGSRTQQQGISVGNSAIIAIISGGYVGRNTVESIGPTANLTNIILEGPVAGFTNVVAKTASFTARFVEPVNLVDANAGAVVVTLPTAVGFVGRTLIVKKTDASANTVTIDPNAAETVDGAATLALATQNESRTLVSDGANWRTI